MRVRYLKKDEIDQCVNIVYKNYNRTDSVWARKEIDEMFKDKFNYPSVIAAVEKGKILGFAVYAFSWMSDNVAELFWLNVDPEHQGKGIATKLIKDMIKRLKRIPEGRFKPTLLLFSCKDKLIPFYEKLGFKVIAKVSKKLGKTLIGGNLE